MNIEISIFTVLKNDLNNVSERKLPRKSKKYIIDSLPKDTSEIETGIAEKSSPGTRQTEGKNLV
jgi:hypothetical protein